jgi:hypothetical protein
VNSRETASSQSNADQTPADLLQQQQRPQLISLEANNPAGALERTLRAQNVINSPSDISPRQHVNPHLHYSALPRAHMSAFSRLDNDGNTNPSGSAAAAPVAGKVMTWAYKFCNSI